MNSTNACNVCEEPGREGEVFGGIRVRTETGKENTSRNQEQTKAKRVTPTNIGLHQGGDYYDTPTLAFSVWWIKAEARRTPTRNHGHYSQLITEYCALAHDSRPRAGGSAFNS